jgi:muramoyltetrapeptide carboxypeptidase
MRILDALPWDRLDAHPKWIVGFSDATALHVVANGRGMCTLHAPNVTGLGRTITASERASLIDGLERPDARETWTRLDVLREGRGRGPVFGGNLTMVASMAAAGRLVVPEGAVLVLEDVTERPYRIDRMFAALRLAGVFDRASAVVFGGFTQCEPGPDGTTVLDVLRDFARAVSVPVLAGAPFGHGSPNRAFVLGRPARVEGDALTFV